MQPDEKNLQLKSRLMNKSKEELIGLILAISSDAKSMVTQEGLELMNKQQARILELESLIRLAAEHEENINNYQLRLN